MRRSTLAAFGILVLCGAQVASAQSPAGPQPAAQPPAANFEIRGKIVGSDAVTWMGRVNGSSELTKNVMLQASYFYRAPMKIERGRFEAMHGANVALRTKLNGDKTTMTLRVNDPFATQKFRVRAGNDQVLQITERNFGARMVWLAFQYNYGRPPRLRQPKADDQGSSSSGFVPPP